MFPRKYKKISSFKRLVLKLLNLYALDKETLNVVNPGFENLGKNVFKLNDKSIILSNGYLKLERKIENLDIIYRYAPNNLMWNSSNRWKRIVPDITKKDLILTSLNTLNKSIVKFLKKNELNISINLISDGSKKDFDDRILKIFKDSSIKINFFKTKIEGNKGSYLESCDQSYNAKDLIFFIEDDYIFEENCIEEMIFTYSRLSTLFNKDIFLCPCDYPFYYDSSYLTSLYLGKNFRWRTVNETLLTFMMSKKLFQKHRKNIRLVGEQKNDPFEKPLHEIYNKEPCLAPVKSLSYHISKDHPATTENWMSLWENNFISYKH